MDWTSITKLLGSAITASILTLLAGILATLGISTGSATEVVGAVVAFVLAAVMHLLGLNKAVVAGVAKANAAYTAKVNESSAKVSEPRVSGYRRSNA